MGAFIRPYMIHLDGKSVLKFRRLFKFVVRLSSLHFCCMLIGLLFTCNLYPLCIICPLKPHHAQMTIAPQIRLEGELGHNPHGTKGPVSGKGSRTGQRTWSVYLARCGQLVIRKHRKATLTPPCRGVAAQRKGNWVGGWVGGGDLCQLPRPHNAAHAIKDSPPRLPPTLPPSHPQTLSVGVVSGQGRDR